ncbi:MAG: hypothetical protein KBS85_04965 [Lachnospiraceae bacterium]|nr:hypothetical protein [Candidatus Merdinaster equi]
MNGLRSMIEERLKEDIIEKRKIAVVPYGWIGEMVDEIARNKYGVEITPFDGKWSEYNKKCKPLKDIELLDSDTVIYIASIRREIVDEIEHILSEMKLKCKVKSILPYSRIKLEKNDNYIRDFKEVLRCKYVEGYGPASRFSTK